MTCLRNWRSLNLSDVIFKGEQYSGFSWSMMVWTSSSLKLLVPVVRFSTRPHWRVFSNCTEIFKEMVNAPSFIRRLGSCVLNQLDVLRWYIDASIRFLSFIYTMYTRLVTSPATVKSKCKSKSTVLKSKYTITRDTIQELSHIFPNVLC